MRQHFTDGRRGRWRGELRATLALAWPLILSNLTHGADPGDRRGADGLARAAAARRLGARAQPHLRASVLLGLGLVTASSPMMATALGASGPARCARCAAPSASRCGCRVFVIAADLAAPVERRERSSSRSARSRRWRATPTLFLHGYMWSMLPFLLFQAMRNFLAALERPGWVLGDQPRRDRPQRAARLGADLRPVRLAGARASSAAGWPARSSGRCWRWRWPMVILTDRQFRRFHLFGRLWRPDWPRFGGMSGARPADRPSPWRSKARCSAPPPI